MTRFWNSLGAAIPAKKVNCSEESAHGGVSLESRTMTRPDPADGDTKSNDTSSHRIDLKCQLDTSIGRRALTHHAIFPPPAEVRIPKPFLVYQPYPAKTGINLRKEIISMIFPQDLYL
jgi:hypothetical protein